MTTSVIIGYILAAVFGFIGGFFIINKAPNHHVNEVRLGTIIFIAVSALWIITGEFQSALNSVWHLGILWLLLIIGIEGGEIAHENIVLHFMKSLRKRDIEAGIMELVRIGQMIYVSSHRVDMDHFVSQKVQVLRCIEELKRKSANLKRPDIASQVDKVAVLVCEYSALITDVLQKREPELLPRCGQIGNDLLEVANYTLSYAEYVLRGSLNARFNMGVLRR